MTLLWNQFKIHKLFFQLILHTDYVNDSFTSLILLISFSEPFDWVMAWEDFVPKTAMLSLFEKHFFPKWLQVLSSWLNNRPNYEEVTKWYKGWKNLMPERLINEPVVKGRCKIILNLYLIWIKVLRDNLQFDKLIEIQTFGYLDEAWFHWVTLQVPLPEVI